MERFCVSLDGQELPPGVTLRDVREEAPREYLCTLPRALGDGLRVGGRRRESLSLCLLVTAEERRPEARAALLQRLAGWASGCRLALSTHPGQYLETVCTGLPASAALDWAELLTLRFTAWDIPYWQEALETTAALTHTAGAADGCTLRVPGTAETLLGFEATAESALDSLAIDTGSDRMLFHGLGLSAGESLRLSRREGFLRLELVRGGQTASAMHLRDAASADELRLRPGRNTVTVSGDGCTLRLRARGRWL